MKNNVKIINNIGKEVVVTVNEVDGSTQIVIGFGNEVELKTLQQGDMFKGNDGTEYIVCEQFGEETAIVRKDLLDTDFKFGDTNNWAKSNIREKLSGDYLKKLEENFGEENILEHEVNLLSMDGYDDYGVVQDKVSLMTFDRYRKYHKHIKNCDRISYLSTPDSTSLGYGSSYVQVVFSDGDVVCNGCDCNGGVRPFCILKSSILVSCVE